MNCWTHVSSKPIAIFYTTRFGCLVIDSAELSKTTLINALNILNYKRIHGYVAMAMPARLWIQNLSPSLACWDRFQNVRDTPILKQIFSPHEHKS